MGFVHFGAINFKGDVLQTKMEIPFKLENTPECLERICQEIETFIDELPCDKSKILNICIGMTGRVNPETGCSYTHLTFGSDHRVNKLANFFDFNIRHSTCHCLPPGVPPDLQSGVKKCSTNLFCGFKIRFFFAC